MVKCAFRNKKYYSLFNYLNRPDRKCPETEKLYDFITTIRQNTTKLDNKGPVVVHCR